MKHLISFMIAAVGIVNAQPLKLEQTIPLPGVEGRIDHLRGEVCANPLVEVGRELAVHVVVHDAGQLDRLVFG